MNAHLSNFYEALVFADECEIDTARLRADAEKIIAEFLISCAPAIENWDGQTEDEAAEDFIMYGEGSAAFNMGIIALLNENVHRFNNWPTLKAYADKIRKEYVL